MRKCFKIMVAIVALCIGCLTEGMIAHAEEQESIEYINIEDIEFYTQAEAMEYLENYIGLPNGTLPISADDVNPAVYVSTTATTIEVLFETTSMMGKASEIGVKSVYLQHAPQGESLFSNYLVPGTFYTTNASSYIGGYSYKKPVIGEQYIAKQTHYFIYNNVEYSYILRSDIVVFQ